MCMDGRTYTAVCTDGDEFTGTLREVVEWTEEHLDMVETLEPGLLHSVTVDVADPALPEGVETIRAGESTSSTN